MMQTNETRSIAEDLTLCTVESIGVFCGSSEGAADQCRDAVHALGEELAVRRIRLICGGGRDGLVGALVDAVTANGGEAVGVMPTEFIEKEQPHSRLLELHVVSKMEDRKLLIGQLSRALIMLPGGIGTMDEFFHTYATTKLGLSHKPFGILNVANYFDFLIKFLENMVEMGFMKPKHKAMCTIECSPKTMLDKIQYLLSCDSNEKI